MLIVNVNKWTHLYHLSSCFNFHWLFSLAGVLPNLPMTENTLCLSGSLQKSHQEEFFDPSRRGTSTSHSFWYSLPFCGGTQCHKLTLELFSTLLMLPVFWGPMDFQSIITYQKDITFRCFPDQNNGSKVKHALKQELNYHDIWDLC